MDYTDNESKKKGFVSMDDIEKFISYLKKSKLTLFSILGGEPTLHPNFIEICERALAENFKIRLFTNGLIPPINLTYLESICDKKEVDIEIILNINHPQMTPDNEWCQIKNTLESLREKVTLGFNIFDAEINFDFLSDLICEYHLNKNIRLGIAQPIVGEQNKHLVVKSYPDVGKKVVEFSEICDKKDIKIGLDCGFVLCMFNESQIGKLIYNNVNFSILCGSIIDIGPDLTVWNCFPLSKMHNVQLEDFETEKQLKHSYDDIYKPYRRFGMMDECFSCKYLLRGQCTGGCIAHKINSFDGGNGDINGIKRH